MDRPKPNDWMPPLADIRHESIPLDIKLGEIAEPTGIEPGEEPAPLKLLVVAVVSLKELTVELLLFVPKLSADWLLPLVSS